MKYTDTEIKNFWGNTLQPLNLGRVQNFSLGKEAAQFMQAIGLPQHNELRDYFLLNFYDHPSNIQVMTHQNEKFLIIGNDTGTNIGISEKTSAVYSIAKDEVRFINTNIRNFIIFLQIFLANRQQLINSSDEEAVVIINHLKAAFREQDQDALNHPDNWWPLVLEQNEQGLF